MWPSQHILLDCSSPSAAPESASVNDFSNLLTCGDDKPEKGGMLFRSGTRELQHIVAIQPSGTGSYYQLVALGGWKKDSKN